MENIFIFLYVLLLLNSSKKCHMTNFKMLISTEKINESSPFFSRRKRDTFPMRFNMITEKNYYIVLNASHHAYVGNGLNLDFLVISYTNRLFLILYENSICAT